ncbi:hypothetical protein [Moritella yayanosii]|uniref:Uncharacterized protein n=1 Tax=Moritella yayanosii TaxID=69539 RepID=A0A330LR39_9GAMM|nr:hypothetical protein [Moritella yayanosii]SQD78902.1 conserved protein of unknown function [Moritella yayanosii]
MISQSVQTDDGGREGKWVALLIILILAIAPFISDKSWERKGKHDWRKVAPAPMTASALNTDDLINAGWTQVVFADDSDPDNTAHTDKDVPLLPAVGQSVGEGAVNHYNAGS